MSANRGRAELPKGWEWKRLIDLLDVLVSGTRPKGGVRGVTEGVPSVGGEHVTQSGDFDWSAIKYVPRSFFNEMKRGNISEGDVLVVKDGATTGKTALVRKDFAFSEAVVNEHVFLLRPSDGIAPEFLFWFLWSDAGQRAVLANFRGAAQGGITRAFAENVLVPVPRRPEQDHIVAEIEDRVSAIDLGTARLQQALTRMDAMQRAVLAEAVNDSWERVPLQQVLVSLRNGIFVSRPAPEPPGIPIFRISAVRPMALDVTDIRYAPADLDPDEKFFVEEGDLLFTRYSGNPNYVGACALARGLPQPTLHPDKLIRGIVDRSQAEPAFLEIACSAGETLREIARRRKTTAGQVGIAGGQLKTVPVPLPSLETQREICTSVDSRLVAVNRLREEASSALRRASELKRAVLHRALLGRVGPEENAVSQSTRA
jgi:type I restriction enzyme, S subunit